MALIVEKEAGLPIQAILPQICAALSNSTALVLQAPPGAGKTTGVPLALLAEPWLAGQTILLLEPRRLAARAAAARMAGQLNEAVGQTVGYRIRFDSQVSRQTRIEVLTEGLLTRRLQRDPGLEGVGLVIFDEFHERSLHADLALALCLDSQRGLRDDLRILVMSATLDGAAVASLLGDAPTISSEGRAYPVSRHYLPRDPERRDGLNAVVHAVLNALAEQRGDLLAFLPGSAEIRQTLRRLEAEPACAGLALTPLYGDLPGADQQRAIQPDSAGRRKVVLATPIAETSLTIEGVTVVVDAGWTRIPRFDPRSGLTRLETVRISADAAEQRAGRAGRLGPGVCYRLWSEATQQRLRPHRSAEILEADLAPLALELAQWGVNDPAALAWLDPPPSGALAQARQLLTDLEALDDQGRITPTGQDLAVLPAHPRLAHLLRRGAALGHGALAADLAALLEERDMLRGDHPFGSDLSARLDALRGFRRDGRNGAAHWQADPAACARIEQSAQRWRRLLRATSSAETNDESVGLLLALAYPDRIARRRDGGADRYQLANGRGVRLNSGDPLLGQDWLVAAHLDAGATEGRIWLAAPVQAADLELQLAARIQPVQEVVWDERQAAVVAYRERRIGALTLSNAPLTDADPELVRQAMLTGIRQLGLDSLPWTRELRDEQARLLSLRHWFPDDAWPDLSDAWLAAHLEEWLSPWLDGIRRRDHLPKLDLAAALHSLLDHRLRARLNEWAPTHLQVPSGSRVRVQYAPGEPPVLAVKLQELFGLADTPRIAEGRIAVTLHLLSPAQRPIQVTQDLRGFWERTYAEVKKELKGRYPKHPWPDDPWTAPPTRRTRRLNHP